MSGEKIKEIKLKRKSRYKRSISNSSNDSNTSDKSNFKRIKRRFTKKNSSEERQILKKIGNGHSISSSSALKNTHGAPYSKPLKHPISCKFCFILSYCSC